MTASIVPNWLRRHWEGEGGIGALLPIAVPMIVTSIFDTLMTFIDRVYLAHVGKEEMSASLAGGITSWMCICLFVGLISYVSTVVAHFYGAGRKNECPQVMHQAILLAVACYPICLLTSWLGSHALGGEGHSPVQTRLERIYFWYLAFGCIVALMRSAYSGFFAGIGKTKVIMVANCVSLVVNLVVNYVLIFGKWGFPAMGIVGAAIGTVLAGVAMALVIGVWYYREIARPEYQGGPRRHFEWEKMRPLIVFGFPNGVGNFLGMASFVVVVSLLSRYGADMAAATTITFNWDNVSFFPMLGMQIGVSTLVGQFMGAKRPDLAERAAYSGYKLTITYALLGTLVFSLLPTLLVSVFTPEAPGVDYTEVRKIAVPMIRASAFYLIFDAITLISDGALKGAGDTFWTMIIGVGWHWLVAFLQWFAIARCHFAPFPAWLVFVFSIMGHGIILVWRFQLGHWKQIKMI